MIKILFIGFLTLTVGVQITQSCNCDQLLDPNDCLQSSQCQWLGLDGCSQKFEKLIILPQNMYCSQFSQTECVQNTQCAFQNNQCIRFSGCSSYVGNTDAKCQKFSRRCTTDGTICQYRQPCSMYSHETCQTNKSSSGSGHGICRWNEDLSICEDQQCSDGQYTTDRDCSEFMSGCVSNGQYCVKEKLFCSQYRGTQDSCFKYQGKDGLCKGNSPNKNEPCSIRLCQDAPTNLNTDQLCSNFQLGCKTTGKGCAMILPLCSQQVGTLTTCLELIGRDGKCKGVSNIPYATCTLQDCQDAPKYLKTDQDCSNYIFGCLTNGKGCTRQLESCYSIFSPIGGNCEGYIGTDGLCENSKKSFCQPKQCNNAPNTHNTDALCRQYQIGCITNGKGCVSKLQLCSSYQGNEISCEVYIGSDGQCRGVDSQIQNCVPRLCKDISVASTNAICKNQLPTCVTDGVGCLDQTTCELTKKQISCQGTSGCQWNSVCHSSNTCHDYLSLALCINNTGGPNSLQCFWDNQQLVGFRCRNACQLQNFTSNLACAGINPLCRTNGSGCIDGGLPCSSYKGTRAQCENFMGMNGTIKCANLSTAVATDVCLVRICTHNATATTNTDCANYLTGCVTNGAGCIPNTEPCSTYKGTQAQCNLFYGQTGAYQCYNDGAATSTTACRNKLCSDISGTTVSACDTQVPGCVTDRTTCVLSTRTCSSFTGTLPQCELLKGNDRRCTKLSHFCRDKVCSDITTPTQQSDCTSYLPTCRYVGSGACIDATGCASYTITAADEIAKVTLCQTLTNTAGKFCTFASGTICTDIGTGSSECSYIASGISDSAKVIYCASFKQASNNRICVFVSGTGKCGIASLCESYTPQGVSDADNSYICQSKLNSSFQPCMFVTGSSTCSTSITNCSYLAYGISTSEKFSYCSGLYGISSKCTFIEGSNSCVPLSSCTSYLAAASNEAASCQNVADNNGKSCYYSSGSSCATSSSCQNYIVQGSSDYLKSIYCYNLLPYGGCVYITGSTTCTTVVSCNSYTLIASTTNDKISSCAILKDSNGSGGCTYQSGNTCTSVTSCDNIKLLNLEITYSNCGFQAIGIDDTSKQKYCNSYYYSATQFCYFDRSGCVKLQSCESYNMSSGTNQDNTQLCQNLIGLNNAYCKYVDNNDVTCTTNSSRDCNYLAVGNTYFDKWEYCFKYKFQNQNTTPCQYDELTPDTCSFISVSCNQYYLSTYLSCFIPVIGQTIDAKLQYCKQFSSGNSCRYQGGNQCIPSQLSCTSYTFQDGPYINLENGDKAQICQDHQNSSGFNCIYQNGQSCSEPIDNNCSQYLSPSTDQEAYCTKMRYSSNAQCGVSSQTCTYISGDTTCSLSSLSCSGTGGVDSTSCRKLRNQSGSSCILATSKCTELTNCIYYTLSGGSLQENINLCKQINTNSNCGKCVYLGNSTCDNQQLNCSDHTPNSANTLIEQQKLCQSIIIDNSYCILNSSVCGTSSKCSDYQATEGDINSNNILCLQYLGGTCRYNGSSTCQRYNVFCRDYLVNGPDIQQICQNLTNHFGLNCSYSSGTNCSDPLYDCSYQIFGTTTTEKIQYCTNLKGQNTSYCAYSSFFPNKCIQTGLRRYLQCQSQREKGTENCSGGLYDYCERSSGCQNKWSVGETQIDKILYCKSQIKESSRCTLRLMDSVSSSCNSVETDCSSYRQTAGQKNSCLLQKNTAGQNCYLGSTTCLNLSSSSNCGFTISDQGSIYLNQQYCNSLLGNFCGFDSTTTSCAAQSCSNLYPVADNDTDRKIYCSLRQYTSNSSCYYITGSTFCSATTVSSCNNYPAIGASVIDRQYYCNKITASDSKQCFFLGSDTTTTTCSDFYQPQSTLDSYSQNCQVALVSSNSCTYNQSSLKLFCSASSGCDFYAFGDTDQDKQTYCLKSIKNISCFYIPGSNTCTQKLSTCAYPITNGGTLTTPQLYQYCQSYTDNSSNKIQCSFVSGNSCTTASSLGSVCGFYAIGTTFSDKLIYCKSLIYSSTQYCTYKTGTSCTQSKVCNQQIIQSTQTTIQKQTFCQTFINDDSINCTYIASNNNCSDPLPDCAYSIVSTGTTSQKTTECETYKSSNGIQCTFQSGLTTCILTTSCGRFLSSNSSQTCQSNNNLSGYACSYTSGIYCSEPLADCTYVAYTTDKTAYCSTLKDTYGNYCTYLSGANCSSRVCVSAPSSRVVSDCTTFKSFCTLDTTYQCDNLECSNNTSATTDTACGTYSLNCLTKNPGCIHRSEPCTSYQGNLTTCQNFKGTNQTILCWVGSTGNCKDRLCSDNTTATTDALCASHIPQPYGSTNPNCVKNQNAGVGCIIYGTCASYSGTTTTCWNYLANDGPCKGTNGNTVAACAQRVCAEAPTTYKTHQQCIEYHPTCLSLGLGCTIKATATCDLFLSGTQCVSPLQNCTWASSCRTILPNCQDYTRYGKSTCVNSYSVKSICNWSAGICTFALCEDLNPSYTTHQQCQNQNKLCTTSGNGCLTISKCANYSLQACLYAYTPELGNKCAIEGVCRALICQDGQYTTTAECDNFLKGCVTNGKYCVNQIVNCSNYLEMNLCQNNLCIWIQANTFQGQCYQYTKCEDIISDNHQYCQLVSLQCTTNGKTCIPFTLCNRYTLQISCIEGSDGICGWLPSNQCQLFRMCSDIKGITLQQCQYYGNDCISDGQQCMNKKKCRQYSTQISCEAGGTDSYCVWENLLQACRNRQCSDARVNTTTIQGCNQFKAILPCTSNGKQCENLNGSCTAYKTQEYCYKSLVGDCKWENSYCRLKKCGDFLFLTTPECLNISNNCISDGFQCIPKSDCILYSSRVACYSGGLDGDCTFDGIICKKMKQCSDANLDQQTCQKYPNNCYYQYHQCRQLSCQQTDQCRSFQQYNSTSLTICQLVNNQCLEINGEQLEQEQCQKSSFFSYRWNPSQNQCETCNPNYLKSSNSINNQYEQEFILKIAILILMIY